MKISVLQENLTKALSIASRFISQRPQLPVLSNVFLAAKKGRLKVSATNLETGITVWLGAKTEKEGSTTIPARLISEVVAGISPERVELEEKEGTLVLSSGNFSSSFSTIAATEFPPVPDSLPAKKASFKPQFVAKVARQVAFAASQDETRPVLSGVLFSPKQAKMEVVATDGFRLSRKEEKGKSSILKDLIVPARAIDELAKILPGEKEKLGIAVSEKENQVLFGTDDVVLTTRVLEGEFPDYKKIIPRDFSTKLTLERENLLQAVRLAAVFAREAANIVKLEVAKGEVSLSAENPQTGQQKARLEAKKEGEDLEVAFNWRFLSDFLSASQGEDLEVALSGPTSPAVFKDTSDPSFLHLIMPIRIQS